MAEFSHGDMPNFSISHDLFSDITAIERFPTLPEKELANLRGKNQNENTSKSAKTWLNVFNECDATKRKSWKISVRKKDGHEYEPESLAVMQCSMDSHFETARKLQYFAGS